MEVIWGKTEYTSIFTVYLDWNNRQNIVLTQIPYEYLWAPIQSAGIEFLPIKDGASAASHIKLQRILFKTV